MAYKRRRSMGRKKTYRKKMRKFVKRKRSNFSRMRFKPEVKYIHNIPREGHPFLNVNTGSAFNSVTTATFVTTLTTWPAQGLTDVNRIGDTIHGIKLWVQLAISSTATYDCCATRFIICNFKGELPSPTPVFQQLVKDPCVGVVDLERVNKVFYDKTFVFNSPGTLQNMTKKTVHINIPMRWPIIFANGGTTPKDPRNNMYLIVLPSVPNVTSSSTATRVTVYTNFYWYDN